MKKFIASGVLASVLMVGAPLAAMATFGFHFSSNDDSAYVTTTNNAVVTNNVDVKADSGDNSADGGNGDDGGNGGDAYAKAKDYSRGYSRWHHSRGGSPNAEANGGDAGNGGNGGNGGEVLTGYAEAASGIVNTVNQTVVRIKL